MSNRIKKHNFAHSSSQKRSILKNLSLDLIKHEHVTTTKAKAKAVKSFVDTIFSRYEKGRNGVRFIESRLGTKAPIKKIDELLEGRLKSVSGGFVHLVRLGSRKGDGAELFKLMLIGYEPKKKSLLKKVKDTSEKESKVDKKAKTIVEKKQQATSFPQEEIGMSGQVNAKKVSKTRRKAI
ncbi:hypothetical protein KC717_04015 [Candidatus Dojkabacteria bacterium]|uniref:50S ribosomal protein L17 n=1 Tax=Candidatus Dojkabacteria bacterium TaxID=2099670 RepID=A0A955L8X2_9BACT|nr:hypothetical protein [Candidatus Dojkabacteria bacterium]